MRNEHEHARWNVHHTKLSADINRLMAAFRKLIAIQYDAPWDKPEKRCT